MIAKAIRWVLSFLIDPVSKKGSMVRVCAIICCIVGCVVAILFPKEWQTVTALIGGGAVALLTRSKGDAP